LGGFRTRPYVPAITENNGLIENWLFFSTNSRFWVKRGMKQSRLELDLIESILKPEDP
jgi:hypothetical protein